MVNDDARDEVNAKSLATVKKWLSSIKRRKGVVRTILLRKDYAIDDSPDAVEASNSPSVLWALTVPEMELATLGKILSANKKHRVVGGGAGALVSMLSSLNSRELCEPGSDEYSTWTKIAEDTRPHFERTIKTGLEDHRLERGE